VSVGLTFAPRFLFFFILFVAAAGPALALEGRIVDSRTGQPVANAEVSILGRPGVARTDADGRFRWEPDPAPPFEVLVIMAGGQHAKPVLVEAVPAGGPLTVTIEPLVEESVTVSAAAPSIVATAASGTTTVSGRDLEVRQPANLAQALETVAGVSTASEGQAAVPVVRGLAKGRTLILIDGARVTSERRVGPSATFLDPFSLEGVEVARGPGSVAYGSDAFGGVIFARTRRVEPGSPLGMRFEGTGGVGVPHGKAGLEVSKGVARGGVVAQTHYREFADYRSPRGDVSNSGSRDFGFLVRGEHQAGPGYLAAGWQTDFSRDVERPRNNSQTVRFYYPTEDSHRFTSSYELGRVGGWNRIGFTGFLGSSAVVTDQDRFATATAPRSIERADVSARDFELRAFAERLFGPAKVEFGMNSSGRFDLEALDIGIVYDEAGNVADTTTNVSIESARRTDLGAYVSLEAAFTPTLTLSAGTRGDGITTRNSGGYFGDYSTSNGAVSGFASLTAGSFGGFSVTGQVARGFREAGLSDRYYRGPTGRGFITGNPELEPETSLQFDVAVRQVLPRLRLAAYAYHYRIHDLIERYEAEPDFFFFRNRGRAEIRGFEIEAQADLGGSFTVELAGQVSRGRALDDDTYLDDIPPESLSVQLRRQFGTRGAAQIRGAAYARDDRPGPTERETPGYGLMDASGSLFVSEALEFRLLARNVFDKEYLLSPDPRTVPAPGASLALTAVVRLGGR
jgi:outer membrane receptor protein involved in Fe transport